MYAQIVTFELAGLADADFRRHCEALAPAFAEIPGLVQKVWLADPESNTYGGLYLWSSREAMEAYQAGEIFASLRANPAVANVTSRGLGVLEPATAVTSRLAEPAAA